MEYTKTLNKKKYIDITIISDTHGMHD
jgi:hypothetical protein